VHRVFGKLGIDQRKNQLSTHGSSLRFLQSHPKAPSFPFATNSFLFGVSLSLARAPSAKAPARGPARIFTAARIVCSLPSFLLFAARASGF